MSSVTINPDILTASINIISSDVFETYPNFKVPSITDNTEEVYLTSQLYEIMIYPSDVEYYTQYLR